jgi:hypothetical protein
VFVMNWREGIGRVFLLTFQGWTVVRFDLGNGFSV